MSDFRFLFYSDEGQISSDWHDTLAVVSYGAGKAPAQKQVMMDLMNNDIAHYGKYSQ